MSCYMYVKEMMDAVPVKTTGAWADLSPYQKLLKENEQWSVDYTEARLEIAALKEEIKKLHGRELKAEIGRLRKLATCVNCLL